MKSEKFKPMNNHMINRFALLALIGLLLFSTGCGERKVFCIKGEGVKETYTLTVDDFDGIDLMVDADVTLSQGPQAVTVTTHENLMQNIKLTVVDGIWEIDYEDCVKNKEEIQIDITMPDLTFAKISGSGTIIGLTTFTDLDELELAISGSGDISLTGECRRLTTEVTGSGDMHLDMLATESIDSKITGSGHVDLVGETGSHDMQITGSGDLHAFDLITDDCSINVSGSGTCEVTANNNLDVKISGSGDVYYRGFPGVNVDISGSGELINAN